jgi:hypothetical protein
MKTLKESLNIAFLKQKPNRADIELFKKEFTDLLERINKKESEEFNKNLIKDFLNEVYYKGKYYINTKGKNDLVIHNDNTATSSVGVLIETKSPENKTEMVSRSNFNVKSFQELILYYLRERKTEKNFKLRYLIITNVHEWFVFDARGFENTFGNDKELINSFNEFENKTSAATKNDTFYKEIAAPAIDKYIHKIESECTHFYIRDYDKIFCNANSDNDNELIALYKFFHPVHLLKLNFADSSQLNKDFYAELLHIIGLEEVTKDGRKLIVHKEADNTGSLIKTAIHQIESDDNDILNDPQYGENQKERASNAAYSLSIIWINRILFLKLLEAQILKYHNGDKNYAFFSTDKLKNYGDLNDLFFSVLAEKINKRSEGLKKRFANVPYLNSSLFERTEIEKKAIFIRALGHITDFTQYSKSVLHGEKPASHLEYLLQFLDAYDFNSDGSENTQEENRPLISASVLGLIFEKINGYKDGSFFTPSFITMYMCRETIGRAVIQKFNDVNGWNCQDIKDVHNKIEDISDANKVFDSIKICDPAVGSGHFLVSVLNEMIYLKHELGILIDNNGKKLKDYDVRIKNDELIITDDEGNYFAYNPKNMESQRIQETFFEEKRKIIENCLFGVDINHNSVEICRLRLWIELLKNTYYCDGGKGELETLPNIDINIKCGDSLISRFDLYEKYAELNYNEQQKLKTQTKNYKDQVYGYKNCTDDREAKKVFYKKITEIKNAFGEINDHKDADFSKWKEAKIKYDDHAYNSMCFGDKNEWERKLDELNREEEKLRKIYQEKIKKSFEWSFEFPEVMDEDGNFVGFDLVIGNPPYVSTKGISAEYKKMLTKQYGFSDDTYNHFFFRGFQLLNNSGRLTYITPKTFWTTQTKRNLRDLLLSKNINYIFDTANPFDAALVDTCITFVQNVETKNSQIKFLDGSQDLSNPKQYTIDKSIYLNTQNSVIFKPTPENMRIFELYGEKVKELYNKWWDKISTSKNIEKNKKELEEYRKSLKPGDIALLGCLTEGGQGLATANNGKYIAVRKSTKWAENILESRPKKLADVIKEHNIKIPELTKFANTAEYLKSLSEKQIALLFDDLKEKYGRDIFGQGYLYRLVDDSEIADVNELTDSEKLNGISSSKKYYVPYDKGDKDGNRWYLETPFAIAWSKENVGYLKTNSGKKGEGMPVLRNPQYYFKEGFCWTNVLTTYIKCRKKQKTVHSTESMSFFSLTDCVPEYYMICMMNSRFIAYYVDSFINATSHCTTGDAKLMPILIPTSEQLKKCKLLYDKAVKLKQSIFEKITEESSIENELNEIEMKLDEFVESLYYPI